MSTVAFAFPFSLLLLAMAFLLPFPWLVAMIWLNQALNNNVTNKIKARKEANQAPKGAYLSLILAKIG